MASSSNINVFYMCCYAWKLLREGQALTVGAIDSPNTSEFFARILLNASRRLLRRGLEQGYKTFEDEIVGLRGKLSIVPTYRKLALQQGRTVCQFDEMGRDTLNNRIIKGMLTLLSREQSATAETRMAIANLMSRFADVSSVEVRASDFSVVALHRNNAHYEIALRICEFVFRRLLPSNERGKLKFVDPFNDEVRMSAVFEEFIRVFCQLELNGLLSAQREDIQWKSGPLDDEHARLLPKMQTDVTLRSPVRTVIVDAKYYKDVFVTFRDAEKVRSVHLYQMFAYLKNCYDSSMTSLPEGLLIYPSKDQSVSLRYELDGHVVRVATINLEDTWQAIHERLRQLLAA